MSFLFESQSVSWLLEDFNEKCIQTKLSVNLRCIQTGVRVILRKKLIYIWERQTMTIFLFIIHSIVAFQHKKWVKFGESPQLLDKFYMFVFVQCRQPFSIIDCVEQSSSEGFCRWLPEFSDVHFNSLAVFGLIQPAFLVGKSPLKRLQRTALNIHQLIKMEKKETLKDVFWYLNPLPWQCMEFQGYGTNQWQPETCFNSFQ